MLNVPLSSCGLLLLCEVAGTSLELQDPVSYLPPVGVCMKNAE